MDKEILAHLQRITAEEQAILDGSKTIDRELYMQGQSNTVNAEKLLAAGKRLLAVIEKNRGGANKDLAKFTSQINDLCDKYDR